MLQGQGFLVKLATAPGFGKVKYCTFQFHSQPFYLHPGNENEVAYVADTGETVQRFTSGECGVKVSNVSADSAGNWQLGASSHTGVDATAEFNLEVIPKGRAEGDADRTLRGRPSDPVEVNCSTDNYGDDEFCEMWEGLDADGAYGKREGCKYSTWYPALHSSQEIRCRTFQRGSMVPVVKKWTLIGEYPGVSFDYLNGDSGLVLRCRTETTPVKSCYIRNLQTGQVYQIANALMGTRYSSYRSNLFNGQCQFEIPKPFELQEVGQWAMQMHYEKKIGEEDQQGVDECQFTVVDGNVFQV